MREIFKRHTGLKEPLSLDEAYLDVTENKTGLPIPVVGNDEANRMLRDGDRGYRTPFAVSKEV